MRKYLEFYWFFKKGNEKYQEIFAIHRMLLEDKQPRRSDESSSDPNDCNYLPTRLNGQSLLEGSSYGSASFHSDGH